MKYALERSGRNADSMNDFDQIIRIRIKRKDCEENMFFGKGIADLLHGVEQYHSLNLAAKQMGMAYSKAWRIMGEAERAMGLRLLHRMRKNGSELTEEGKTLLKAYEEAQQAAQEAVRVVMGRYSDALSVSGSDAATPKDSPAYECAVQQIDKKMC